MQNAYQESPFYKKVLQQNNLSIDEILQNWEKVPVIQKREMVTTNESIVPLKYYVKMTKGELRRESTSGSTGQCLEIYWDNSDYIESLFPLWIYRKKYYNINPSDRLCYFYTMHNPYGKEPLRDENRNGLGFSKLNLSDDRIAEIYDQIVEYDPVWMLLQPSIAMLLARYVFSGEAEELKSLKYIELTGEILSEENKRFISAAFECSCANQYGSYEVNSIAYECPMGHMHVMEENVFVEMMWEGKKIEEGKEGNIIVTSLRNKTMPFVRYDIGDYGVLHSCNCEYNKSKVLELTRGRKNDVILCRDGNVYHAYELIRPFSCMNEQLDERIFQYKITQVDYEEFIVHVVTDAEEKKVKDLFQRNLQNEYLQNCSFEFCFCDSLLPEEDTGKLQLFKNCINEKGRCNV